MAELRVDVEAVEGYATFVVEPRTESVSVPDDDVYGRVPFFMPQAQVYYWSTAWQEGESEALAELRRGEARTFGEPEDAIRWLDEPESGE